MYTIMHNVLQEQALRDLHATNTTTEADGAALLNDTTHKDTKLVCMYIYIYTHNIITAN